METKKEIKYLNSFKAETSAVTEVIANLVENLKKAGYPTKESDEIIISMDESLTNAIQSTIKRNNESSAQTWDITVRYIITENDFEATIIDHGSGINLLETLTKTPQAASACYYEQIKDYGKESDKNKLKLRVNGQEVCLSGIGAGLKIILSFMDSITIDMIDRKTIVSTDISGNTDGTIFNIKRKRRYH